MKQAQSTKTYVPDKMAKYFVSFISPRFDQGAMHQDTS